MGERGPRPTPTEVLKLRGSWRANNNPDEPQPDQGRPEMPQGLDPVAQAAWQYLVEQTEQMRVLTMADGYALEMLARCWSRWQEAEDSLTKHGNVFPIRNEDGSLKYLQQSPYVSIARNLGDQVLKLLREFGLTPSARTRIATEPTQTVDPLQELLARRNG
tara:strand:- start:23633 stop:24115 length:483 start_codon:yes stop_codon:yes gene_type:complete